MMMMMNGNESASKRRRGRGGVPAHGTHDGKCFTGGSQQETVIIHTQTHRAGEVMDEEQKAYTWAAFCGHNSSAGMKSRYDPKA